VAVRVLCGVDCLIVDTAAAVSLESVETYTLYIVAVILTRRNILKAADALIIKCKEIY